MKKINQIVLSDGKIINDNEFKHYAVEKLDWTIEYDKEAARLVEPWIQFYQINKLRLYYSQGISIELLKIVRMGHVKSIIESKIINTETFNQKPFYDKKTGLYTPHLISDFIATLLSYNNLSRIKNKTIDDRELDRFYLL